MSTRLIFHGFTHSPLIRHTEMLVFDQHRTKISPIVQIPNKDELLITVIEHAARINNTSTFQNYITTSDSAIVALQQSILYSVKHDMDAIVYCGTTSENIHDIVFDYKYLMSTPTPYVFRNDPNLNLNIHSLINLLNVNNNISSICAKHYLTHNQESIYRSFIATDSIVILKEERDILLRYYKKMYSTNIWDKYHKSLPITPIKPALYSTYGKEFINKLPDSIFKDHLVGELS